MGVVNRSSTHQTPALSAADLSWLRRLARNLVNDPDSADDLVQDTLVAALGADGDQIREPRAWLRSVAARLRSRHARARIRRRDHEHLAADSHADRRASHAPASAELVAAAEAGERVASVARALPEPYRRAILEHYIEGLDPTQIARRAGEKVDTVRWRLRRGLELMRSELGCVDTGDSSSKEDWALALAPLASLPNDAIYAGAAGATKNASVLQGAFALVTMKVVASIALIAVLSLLALNVLGPSPNDSELASAIQSGASDPDDVAQALQDEDGDPLAPIALADEREALEDELPSAPDGPPRISGRVVDETGRGLEGALVYVLGSQESGGDSVIVAARASTDVEGRFLIEASGATWSRAQGTSLALGAAATGFLRSGSRTIEDDESLKGVELTLRSGAAIEGRIEDLDGRPVAGLMLWAGDRFQRSGDLSMSRVQLRAAERSVIGPEGVDVGHAVARTDGAGRVTLTGLPVAPCVVRSLDPAWQLVSTDPVQGGSQGNVWVAAPRYGIRVRASVEGSPMWRESSGALSEVLRDGAVEISSTFRVELAMEDGSVFDTGQWIGSGPGEVSLALTPSMDPRVEFSQIQSATFYGTAKLKGDLQTSKAEWRSSIITKRAMESHTVPTAYVNFGAPLAATPDTGGQAGDVPSNVQLTSVEFDVRLRGSGAPFAGPLYVSWACELAGGTPLEGDERAERLPSGRYKLRVPAERMAFEVAVGGASGSLPPWRGSKDCSSSGGTVVFVELDGGGTALIHRPPGWEGKWWIRAARRVDPGPEAAPGEEATWFGAWAYSIDAPIHPLRALEAGTWRFELREDPDQGPPSEVRTAEIKTGDAIDVR